MTEGFPRCDESKSGDNNNLFSDLLHNKTSETKGITILKRPENYSFNSASEISNIISPKLPYHKRWEAYRRKRDEIFNISALGQQGDTKPKRSTIRLR